MEYQKHPTIQPRLILQGGAGNIIPSNFPPEVYKKYHYSLLRILVQTHAYLTTPIQSPSSTSSSTKKTPSALDTVTYAVTLLENNPLFNAGHGAVFTRDGINELEASIMVSRGKKKRGVGVMGLQHVKNPIKLAREMLVRGERDLEFGNGEHRHATFTDQKTYEESEKLEERKKKEGPGAQGHSQLHKASAEALAEEWGLDLVDSSYFFTQSRWDEHLRGLENESKDPENACATWDAESFFPQGTCGAAALDSEGVIATATSTGGLTNKLPGRIGDTPTLGAGFWAEEWDDDSYAPSASTASVCPTVSSISSLFPDNSNPVLVLSETLKGLLADCFPSPTLYTPLTQTSRSHPQFSNPHSRRGEKLRKTRSTALSGTGNGDSFLRINAARTASAIARYTPSTSLQSAVTQISGPAGELQKSAGDRWRKTGEGEGGLVGIELTVVRAERGGNGNEKGKGEVVEATSEVVWDYNCGGMFRAAVGEDGKGWVRAWRDGQYEDLEKEYPWEKKIYDLRDWFGEKRT